MLRSFDGLPDSPSQGESSASDWRAPLDPPARPQLANDVTEAIGNVPIVRLNRVSPLCLQHDLYVKLEACNPGGSIKEKNAVHLVNEAEARGWLQPGGTIVESSSGNFGVGLAMVGAARGYRVMIVVDAKTPPPMRRLLAAYGAKLVDVPLSASDEHGSMQVARMRRAQELTLQIDGAWYPCQHLNPSNPESHYLYTALEIEDRFQGAPDAVVLGISTAGQLAGIAKFFRAKYPRTKIVGVDVAGSVVLGTPAHSYKMTGLGLSFVPPNFKREDLDVAYSVDDATAFSVCHVLAGREGLLLGGSTGAIVAAGIKFASTEPKGRRVLMINPDRGDRYLETIYNGEWLAKQSIGLKAGTELDEAIEGLKPVLDRRGS